MIYQTGKGFIYQYTSVEDMDMGAVVVGFFAILILFSYVTSLLHQLQMVTEH